MEINIMYSDSSNRDFINLITLLDNDLNGRYGELQKQYNNYNHLDFLNNVVIVYMDGIPAACGALKEHDKNSMELKRIFVKPDYRGQGLAKAVVGELERIGRSKGFLNSLLETGVKQTEAIGLYHKLGYITIDNFEPYIGNENSICMKKDLQVF